MKYTKLGSSGLEVSRICLGCMSFGEKSPGAHDWSLDEASSRPIIERALDLGINFFDTANAYSLGSSEEITGRALRDMANRDEIVIATKVYFPVRRGRNSRGLSRKAIMTEVDASLACRTSTACSSVRKSARCTLSAPTRASGRSRGVRWA